MGNIQVVTPGLLTTIQDAGRFKYQQSGVCVAGVMDTFAHRVANILVGNQNQTEAVLEITMMGPTLVFQNDAFIAIAGADLSPAIDGTPIKTWQSHVVHAGSQLTFGGMKTGMRAYLAIAGGFNIPIAMESKSTYVKAKIGGYEGRPLKAGDMLPYLDENISTKQAKALPARFIPEYGQEAVLRTVLGPQDDYFTDKGIKTLFENSYTVSPEFDRMGYRLEGEAIEHKDGGDIISDGTVMGAIQVPGKGQPIILMADRQTTGGYTKIGTVISTDLPQVGQAAAGKVFRFQQVSVEEAQDIYIETQKIFDEISRSLFSIGS